MNSTLKKNLKTVLPILLGVLLIWFSYNHTSPEDRKLIVENITNASPFWIGVSVLIGVVSHVSRAIRWKYLLQPMGYQPSLMNSIFMVFMAYLANLGIPRSGEFLRATALDTYEDVPFEKGFGTIVTERVVDLLMLLLIILITLLLQTDIILAFLTEKGSNLLIGLGILVVGIVGLIISIRILKHSSSSLVLKIKSFLNGLLEGVLSIFKMENKWKFLLHTFIIWVAYVAMFWVVKYTVTDTHALSLSEILVAFIAGAFAMTATNGGIGIYPIAVSGALALFGISATSGDAFGWIMWIAQTLMVVVFGAISFLLLPLLNKH